MDTTNAHVLPDTGPCDGMDGLNVADDVDVVIKRNRALSNPLAGEDFVYNMSHPRRGVAIIFNNKDFRPQTRIRTRKSTEVDAENLSRTLQMLGFEVREYTNLTCSEMVLEMKKAGLEDHSDADCFVLTILSHGDEYGVYGTDGDISLDDLTEPIKGKNCRSLVGKPKLFFIQAPRGEMLDIGAAVDEDQIDSIPRKTGIHFVIPHEADVIMASSSVPGYHSWHNSKTGSWFIRALCDVLDQYGSTLELMQLMTRVNYLVAQIHSDYPDPSISNKKQIPEIITRLTKEVYFTKK